MVPLGHDGKPFRPHTRLGPTVGRHRLHTALLQVDQVHGVVHVLRRVNVLPLDPPS